MVRLVALGKMEDGRKLLAAFAVLMMIVAAMILHERLAPGQKDVRLNRKAALRLVAIRLRGGLDD